MRALTMPTANPYDISLLSVASNQYPSVMKLLFRKCFPINYNFSWQTVIVGVHHRQLH